MAEYQVYPSEIMVMFYGLPMSKDISVRQENTQESTQDEILTNKEKRILAICTEPKSKQEIADLLGYKSIKSIKSEMERLLYTNRLTMTIPDKPKSKNQKYVRMKNQNKDSLMKHIDKTVAFVSIKHLK